MNAHDQALTPLSIDIENVICDMNRLFNPLHKDFILDYKVQAARDGYVLLTIALPDGIIMVFASMLESMSGFFHFMHIKSKSAKASSAAFEPSEILRCEQFHNEFLEKVSVLFDGFVQDGYSDKESVRLTNSAMKEQNHPWACCYDTIMRLLCSTGRFRKNYKAKLNMSNLSQ